MKHHDRAPFALTGLAGVRAAGVAAGLKASGNRDVGLLVFDDEAACSGVFTQNKLPAAPVVVSRAHLAASGGRVRAIVVSSGNANACTGEGGTADAGAMAAQVAAALGCATHQVLVCSTGVIGVPLPMEKVRRGIDAALAALGRDGAAGLSFLDAIQTTDAFPKDAAVEVALPVGAARVAGVCKGAGMIHPSMATMLAFVGTDAAASPAWLQGIHGRVAKASFNAIHVDTHASTNDTFLLFATGKAGVSGEVDDVAGAMTAVARRLSWLIARDGEGATKVTTVTVKGARSEAAARAIADRVVASALVRTALFGNDPNWGRFVSAVGNAPEVGRIDGLRCTLQGICVFAEGAPTAFDRAAASAAMKAEDVSLVLDLGEGEGAATLLTSDLGYRYVEVNAEYTT